MRHGQEAGLTKRSSKYVGLDVHQASIVSAVREETGRVLARTVVPTEGRALRDSDSRRVTSTSFGLSDSRI